MLLQCTGGPTATPARARARASLRASSLVCTEEDGRFGARGFSRERAGGRWGCEAIGSEVGSEVGSSEIGAEIGAEIERRSERRSTRRVDVPYKGAITDLAVCRIGHARMQGRGSCEM